MTKPDTLSLSYLAMLVLASQIPPVHATQDTQDVFNLSLIELMNIPVKVAVKRDTLISHSPSNITAFSAQQLDEMGITNLVELLNAVPGFYAMYNPVEGNQSYVVTRGHSQKYASNVLFLVNGQRLNDDYTGGINYFNRFMPLTFAQRVEIIRGPGSSLYGSNAFNGVVNIITKPQSQIRTSLSSFDGYGASIGSETSLQNISMAIGIQYKQDKGDTFDVSFDRFGLQDTTRDPKEQLHIDAQLSYNNFTWQTLWYESSRQDYYLFRRLRDDVTQIDMSQLSTGLTWVTQPTERLNINSYLQYQHSHRESLTALAVQDPIDLPDADFLFGEDIDYHSTRVGTDIQLAFNQQQHWDTGFEWVSSQVPSGRLRSNYHLFNNDEYLGEVITFRNSDQRVVQDKTREIFSVYSQLESQWQNNISTMMGIRYDEYNDTGSRWSPRFSLIHQASEFATWKLIYSEAYRAPSLGDLYDDESGLTSGSDNLTPPTIRSTEVSYGFVNHSQQVNIVIFNNEVKNLIGFATINDETFLDNVSSSQSQGIEWEWIWLVTDMLKLINQATLLTKNSSRSEQTDLTPNEDLSPKYFGLSALQWKLSPKLKSHLGMLWRSSVNVLQKQEELQVWRLKLDYTIKHNQRLSLTVNNLLDTSYNTASALPLGTINADTVYQEYPARGREWLAEYRFKW